MINAITSALSGLSAASKQVDERAQNIANPSSESQLIEDIVDIKVATTAYKANLAVLETVDELNEELLNSFDEIV